jgi:hypothetical protein
MGQEGQSCLAISFSVNHNTGKYVSTGR